MNDCSLATGKPLSSLFRLAALAGVRDSVVLHLRRGDDVNAVDSAGRSPLMLAASRGHVGVCKLLIEAGANMLLVDGSGLDAAAVAFQQGATHLADFIRASAAETLRGSASADSSDRNPNLETVSIPNNSSTWEDDPDSFAPECDTEEMSRAKLTQDRLSAHVPVDDDAEWNEVEINLPSCVSRPVVEQPRAALDTKAKGNVEVRSSWAKPVAVESLSSFSAFPKPMGVWRERSSEAATDSESASDLVEEKSSNLRSQPSPTSSSGKIWATADRLSANGSPPPTLVELMTHECTKGVSHHTVRLTYARWLANFKIRTPTPVRASHGAQPSGANKHISSTKGHRPESATISGAIWAAADALFKLNEGSVTVEEILAYPTLEGFNPYTVRAQFTWWRKYQDLPASPGPKPKRQSNLDEITKPASSSREKISESEITQSPSPSRKKAPELERDGWEKVATYWAELTGYSAKDMRPMSGYFWVLINKTTTDEARGLATKLIELEFEHVTTQGFRRK